CDKHRLPISERLELFADVCEAVQHAHQKGIIHRDLKPSNVLVCVEDGKATPKVIDFGLAKALQHQMKLTDKTVFTEFGQVVGTVQYMSPEQAEMSHLDIDTRTDIYSLGVILYELLTGSTPIDPEFVETRALMKVLTTIREQEPPRPSVRLSCVRVEVASGISDLRQVDTVRLKSLLRGDLDWIAMKALEIDRTRRYETANGLALDVGRYLAGDPILARPPTPGYRLRKLVQKNRGVFAALSGFTILLCVGIVVTSYLAIAANEARHEAVLAQQEATQAAKREELLRLDAESAKTQANREAKRAQAAEVKALAAKVDAEEQADRANKILNFVVDSFAGLDPWAGEIVGQGSARKQMTAKDVLDQTTQQLMLSNTLSTDPIAKALLLSRLGTVYREFEEIDRAINLLSRADGIFREQLGEEDLQTIKNLRHLGNVILVKNPKDSVPLYEKCVRLHRENFGTDSSYYAEILGAYGYSLQASGDPQAALPILEEAIVQSDELNGEDSRASLKLKLYLADCHRLLGDLNLALNLQRSVLDVAVRTHGDNDGITSWARFYLSGSLKLADRWDDALVVDQRQLAYLRTTMGDLNPQTILAFTQLGRTYESLGESQQAWDTRSTLFQILKRAYGLNDPRTLASFSQLVAMFKSGQYQGWDEFVDNVVIELKGKDLEAFMSSDQYLEALLLSANQFARGGSVDEASRLFGLVLEQRKQNLGLKDPRTLATALHVARFLQAQALDEELIRLLEDFPIANDIDQAVIEVRSQDRNKFQKFFTDLLTLDFTVVQLWAESDENEDVTWIMRLQPAWLPQFQGREFISRSWSTPEDFLSENDRLQARGYSLQGSVEYRLEGDLVVAALWIRQRRPTLWTDETDVPVAGESEDSEFGDLDREVARFVARHQVPGLTFAISRGGDQPIYQRGFGWAKVDEKPTVYNSRFRVASVSKILTGIAIFQLMEQGHLKLDDPVIEHLPKQCVPSEADRDARVGRITIRHLLNHAGGWNSHRDHVFHVHEIAKQTNQTLPLNNDELIRFVLEQPLDYQPGERGEYVNIGYQILGRVIEHRGGLPYEEFVRQETLVPLGMAETTLGRTSLRLGGENEVAYYESFLEESGEETGEKTDWNGQAYGDLWMLENMDAAAGWISTTTDLLKMVQGMARDRSPKLLSEESWKQYFAEPKYGHGSDWRGAYHANGWTVNPGENGSTYWTKGWLTGSSCFVAYYGDSQDQFATALLANASHTPNDRTLTNLMDEFQSQMIRRFEGLLPVHKNAPLNAANALPAQ
ncbi:MAG: serine hydrolase, partial [Planctomycetota bacterium]